MMPRIIVKAIQKRNETGVEPNDNKIVCALTEAFLPIDLYKSTQRERLNLYRVNPYFRRMSCIGLAQSCNLHI
jgi:hypothetical protein